MMPSRDPRSTKYPDRVFYAGRWRTPEQIATQRANVARNDKPENVRERTRRYEQTPMGRLNKQLRNMTRVRV